MRAGILGQLAAVACVASEAYAATEAQWRSRSIYQILTDRFARTDGDLSAPCDTSRGEYCGGTWQGIINQLDYIQDMGFTAVWISPVTYNYPHRTIFGYAYHGYWQQDLYRLNENFGTADDLKSLSLALHDRGMYLMVDVVTNHNAWVGDHYSVDYSQFYPFNDQKYYHSFCPVSDYSNQTQVEDCWLGDNNVPLPDLRTEDDVVKDGYNTWIKQLISNYSIDGLRVDTAKHVDKDFWISFQAAAGVYAVGEVFAGDARYVCDYQGPFNGLMNYPAYYPILHFFNGSSYTTSELLGNLQHIKSSCPDVSLLGVFTENHDLPRFASGTQDKSLAKGALTMTLLWDGIPIIYQGQEQHYSGYKDPANREAVWLAQYSRQSDLYQLVAAINEVRNQALALDAGYATYNVFAIYSDDHTIALRKGFDGNQIISVYTNTGNSSAAYTLYIGNTGWSPGTTVFEVVTCAQVTITSDGRLTVPMAGGVPRVYFAVNAAKGSGICGGAAGPVKKSTSPRFGERRGTRRSGGQAAAVAGVVAAAIL